MIRKIFVAAIFSLLMRVVFGQCPEKSLLRQKIEYYKDTIKLPFKKVSIKERIDTLLKYRDTIANCPYKNDSTHTYLLRQIALYYRLESDYLNAVRYLREAIDIIESNFNKPTVIRKELLVDYFFLFDSYRELDNVSEEMKAVDKCLDVADKLGALDDYSSIRALHAKTQHYFNIGDFNNCVNYATNCERLCWDMYDKDRRFKDFSAQTALICIGWQIEALLRLKEYKKAEDLVNSKFETIQNTGLPNYQAMLYDRLGNVEISKGDFSKASRDLERALSYYKKAGAFFNCKQVANEIACNIYFKNLNDNKKALRYYFQALNFRINYKTVDETIRGNDSMESLNIFNRIANLYISKNEFDSADKYFQASFNYFQKDCNENLVLQMPAAKIEKTSKIDYLAALLIDRADAYKKQYIVRRDVKYLERGINAYKIADKFLESIKNALSNFDSKLFWRNSARHLYENAIEACYLENNTTDAFYFFEQSRAVLLNDQLNEQRWLNQEDILKQNQLKKNIQQLLKQQEGMAVSSTEYSDLENKILENRRQLENLENQIKTSSPLYYQSFVDKNVVTIEDVRKRILNDHKGLLEIFSGDSAVYFFAITNRNIFFKKADKLLYDSVAEKFRNYLANSDYLNSDFNGFLHLSNQLYNLIFQQIELEPGRIIISPDGKYFPFEALIVDTQSQSYFLNDYAVSYTYSARYLMNDFQQKSISTSRSFFGIAPVEFSQHLATLKGSDESLKRMRNYFSNAKMLTHRQATKNNFLTQFPDYGIIQLYAHAADNEDNGEPTIYFADSTLLLLNFFMEKDRLRI